MSTDQQEITEEWLREAGFKWHQLDRQPDKQWLLWIRTAGLSGDELGVEVAPWKHDKSWFCWLRSDVAHRYHRVHSHTASQDARRSHPPG